MNNRNIRKAHLKYADDGHSEIISFTYGNLQIWPIPCIFDNYAYVIADTKTNDVVVVDVGHGSPVLRFLEKHSMVPKAILTTHRHWDHCGGNRSLKKRYSSVPIYGSDVDTPNGVTRFLSHEQELNIESFQFVALATPGHTKGHLVYLLKGENHEAPDCLFTGDLLFLAGCGKLFEGTAEEMLRSMELIGQMSDSTLIWPGHEYAVADLLYTCREDPHNSEAREKLSWALQQRQDRLPTCPSTLKEEKEYNLFLRCGDLELLKRLGIVDPLEENISGDEKTNEEKSLVVDFKMKLEAFMRLRKKKDGIQ